MRVVKFKLDEQQHAVLEGLAAKLHGSVPQVIKLAIDAYLKAAGLV